MKNKKKSSLAEAVTTVTNNEILEKTILEFRNKLTANQGKMVKTIALTSPKKHSHAACLSKAVADVFAKDGEKTLLIDACMHGSTLEKLYKVNTNESLSKIYDIKDRKKLCTKINNNLDLVVAGVSNYPAKILESNVFKMMMVELKENYNRIIILVPPILRHQDLFLLKDIVESVILVGKKNETRINDIKDAIELLKSHNFPFMGTMFVAPIRR